MRRQPRRLTGVYALLWLWCSLVSCAWAEPATRIYFYNPEININRNAVLKDTVDHFLQTQGAFEFQPVANRDTFEALLQHRDPRVFIMSSSHFMQVSPSHPRLTAHLVGQRNASTYYRRLLVIGSQSLQRRRIIIAVAGSENLAHQTLADMQQAVSQHASQGYELLIVPKDMDAVMAVNFGMADAALCSEQSLAMLAELSPQQHQQLRVIARSQPLLHMQVIAPTTLTANETQLLNALLNMNQSPVGKRALHMLGLDSWTHLPDSKRTAQLYREGNPR